MKSKSCWLFRINTTRSNNRLINSYGVTNKYGVNSKTALFIISGEKNNIGEVLCINNEVSESFGFDKSEIVGHNISKVMPPIIAEKHSQFITNYLKAEKQRKMDNVFIVPLHKLGYVVPCSFLLRVVPNLKRGLQLIGFLVKVTDISEYCQSFERNLDPDDTMMLLTDDEWKLHAFNIRAAHCFGINPVQANLKKYHTSDEKIPVAKFIADLEDPEFLKQAQCPLAVNAFINLRVIRKAMESEVEIITYNPDQENFNSLNAIIPSLENTYCNARSIDGCIR